jgi:UDP-N-acetylmuramyl pentapeptide phosphotransferase/UDP-N-acetylglucosamine-1-phosphate transferase
VIGAALTAAAIFFVLTAPTSLPLALFGACIFLAIVGAADDIRPVPVLPRLLLQAIAVGTVLSILPSGLQIFPMLPLWLERGIVLIGGLWFINLVNFMDGLDWMTVSETVPITAALILLGALGTLTPMTVVVAAALGGAMLGFAPFNRPVAKVFLGDVGSLPIGLLLGWCLLELAYRGQFVAALLLPLYYLADATVTILRRLVAGENIWAAHRSHFYQRATDNGFSVLGVVGIVFILNLGLTTLAIISTATSSTAAKICLLGTGVVATGWVMFRFVRRR